MGHRIMVQHTQSRELAYRNDALRLQRELDDAHARLDAIARVCRAAQDCDKHPSYGLRREMLHVWQMTGVQLRDEA